MTDILPTARNNYVNYIRDEDTSQGRIRPQNIDAEESILGGILLDPNAIARVNDILTFRDFYVQSFGIIYQMAQELYLLGQPVDMMTVASRLEDRGLLEKVGGIATLTTVAARTVSTVNIDRYAELVKDKSLRRELMAFLSNTFSRASDCSIDLPEIESYIKNYFVSWSSGSATARYTRDLIEYDKIKNSIARRKRKRQLCKEYEVSHRDFELDLIDALDEQNQKKEKIEYTLEEIAAMPDAELDFLIPGLTPRGEGTIITGPPKACKTLFTIDMIDSLLAGSTFMGRPVPKSKVVYFNCDQSMQMFRSQLQGRGILELVDKYGGESLITYNDLNLENVRGFAEILDKKKPDVVFIDSLTGIIKDSETNICDPSIRGKVERFFKECEKRNISLFLIHHNGKSDSNTGSQKMLGSALFAAIPSAIISLEPIDPKNKNNPKRILKTDLRFGGNIHWECEINPYYEWHKDGCLKFAKDLNDPLGETQTAADRILAKIENSELDRIEVAELVAEEDNKSTAYKAIKKLEQLQLIDRKPDEHDRRKYFVIKKRRDSDMKAYSGNTTAKKSQHENSKNGNNKSHSTIKDESPKDVAMTESKNSGMVIASGGSEMKIDASMSIREINIIHCDNPTHVNNTVNFDVIQDSTSLLNQHNTTTPMIPLIYKSQQLVNLRLEDIQINQVEHIKEYGEAKLYSAFISGEPPKLKLADPYGFDIKDFCLEKVEAIYLKE